MGEGDAIAHAHALAALHKPQGKNSYPALNGKRNVLLSQV